MSTTELVLRYLLCGFIVNYFTIIITDRIKKWTKVTPQYKIPYILSIIVWPYNFVILLFVGLVSLLSIVFILTIYFFVGLTAVIKFIFYSFVDFVKSHF